MTMNVLNSGFKKDVILTTKFPVKNRDIHKIEKPNYIDISVCCFEDKKKHQIYAS